jgi:alpha-D-ribose 1-methylphosphonate 5-triphosphate diphosphatase
VHWDPLQAAIAHDAQIAAAGITTVFDSLVVGLRDADQTRRDLLGQIMAAVEKGEELGLFRAQHLLHLRCEVTDPTLLDQITPHMDHPLLQLVSVMEHTVGQRQFPDPEKYREILVKLFHVPEDKVDERFRRDAEASRTFAPTYRDAVCRLALERGIAIAAHDDETLEHVEEAARLGMTISEFPTTLLAAEAARERGMATVMGAPNVVKGGSHSGNVSALELARAGLLDALASDYVPISLLAAPRVALPPYRGHEGVHGGADELSTLVAEHRLGVLVHEHYRAFTIHHDDRVGGGLQQAAERLFTGCLSSHLHHPTPGDCSSA